jgi:diguanylate cyclase (GGDEF)-like protein/PAS domain S-box-containing protein
MNKKSKRSSNDLPTPKNKRAAKDKIENDRIRAVQTESDDKYRGFIENLPVMFYAVEPFPPHTPMYISPAFEVFGYPLEDWHTKSDIWSKVVHPDDTARIMNQTRIAIKKGEGIDYEYRIIGKDGSIFWIRDRACFIKDEKGKKICWQGIILDITDRKQAEIELERREELYRTLTRNIPKTAVLIFDHDFRYSLADGTQLKEHKFSREMFEGKTLFEVFPPEIAGEWEEYYRRALAGEVVSLEKTMDDGCFQIYVVPVKNENDEVYAGMAVWQDITERKSAEASLKESEARYRNLFENANDLIYVHDLKGNYLSVNQTAERVIGYTREEAMKMNMREIIVPSHYKRTLKMMKEKFSGAEQTVYEVDCVTKDGKQITLEVNSSLIDQNGSPLAVQGIARDITERKRAEQSLKESEESYRELFENANDLIYTHDLTGNFTSLNRAGETITGFTRVEALKMNICEVVAPEFLEAARAMTARKVEGDAPTAYELEIIAKDGHRVYLELSTRLILQNGVPIGVQGIGRDITERKRTEKSLHNTVSLFISTFESTADGIVVIDPNEQRIITFNRKFVEMFNLPPKVLDQNNTTKLVEFVSKQIKDPEKFLEDLEELYSDPLATATHILEFTDGRIYERYSQPQFMEDKPVGRVCCFRDITKRRHAEERLLHYALHDTLTNLPNRAQFMNHLKQAVERAEGNPFARFAVLFLDLDRFKVINDSLGHAIGDKLLVAIAERLSSCIRPGDVVARLGGDEFTILLNRTGGVEDVARVAERLQKKLSEPFRLNNYEVFTSASIGIIVSDDLSRQPDDFLRDADAAMYRAKESGKARYEIFDTEMHVRNMNLLQVEMDLRHAIDRDEFEVFYQPIVSLQTGEINEFEALIRWRHPKHGLVAPNEFISVAEETGLIIQIGKWILAEACRQTSDWQKRFPNAKPLSISVNLSAKQLMHPALMSQVSEILLETGLNPRHLKLEVTESTVMENSETALGVLSELRELGISLSTDDFGTGYSSLSYLHRFPFERLKIDRSFINKMDLDDKSEAIVRTILLLGQNLNIETVAEGIETEKQLEILRAHGCPYGQGFLFSKPLAAEDAARLLEEGLPLAQNSPLMFGSTGEIFEVSEIH